MTRSLVFTLKHTRSISAPQVEVAAEHKAEAERREHGIDAACLSGAWKQLLY